MAHRWRRAVAEETSHVLQSLAQKIYSTPQGRLACRYNIGAVSDAPYEVVRASFRKKFVACVQEMGSHGWVLSELGARADEYDIFSLAFSRRDRSSGFLAHIACAGEGQTRA